MKLFILAQKWIVSTVMYALFSPSKKPPFSSHKRNETCSISPILTKQELLLRLLLIFYGAYMLISPPNFSSLLLLHITERFWAVEKQVKKTTP